MSADDKKLIAKAIAARGRAYCPYSGFAVGAALLTASGTIYTGANIENVSFSATNCAERTAFFSAIAAGETSFLSIAVCGGRMDQPVTEYCPPCGICRQVMVEFCKPDFEILLVKSPADYYRTNLNELMPLSFGTAFLH